jgi:protein gp37
MRIHEAARRHRVERHRCSDGGQDGLWPHGVSAAAHARVVEAVAEHYRLLTKRPMNIKCMLPARWLEHPQPHVWLATSVENQKQADLRIPHLVPVPAVVHFLGAEPLPGPLDLAPWLEDVEWVITGGESGPRHRGFDVAWVRDMHQQCQAPGVAHFFKQHGGCLIDGVEAKEFPTPRLELAA